MQDPEEEKVNFKNRVLTDKNQTKKFPMTFSGFGILIDFIRSAYVGVNHCAILHFLRSETRNLYINNPVISSRYSLLEYKRTTERHEAQCMNS